MLPTALIRQSVPPILWTLLRSHFGNRFRGSYPTWEEAKAASSGYDDKAIIDKVAESARAVRDGRKPYERDGVVFDSIQYSWPMIACLMLVAARQNGVLRVLDIGGSLGTSFRQGAKFFKRLAGVSWAIVEQSQFVELGNREFSTPELAFFHDIDSAVAACEPNVALFSGVLQYLESPMLLLDTVLGHKLEYLLFDRTPFIDGREDRLTRQIVPRHIHAGSYPAWFFSKQSFFSRLERNYTLVEAFEGEDRANLKSTFEGSLWQRK
ncbi:MAG TPA: methyltransferase, TIGR04325 family [Polyangiaceae bacterium]|nr:methyltransferase, TIGR04325 family [Polyangiaceae bacterium]